MAIANINGPMITSNLLRYGVDLAVETDLLYCDVALSRIGIKTSSPSQPLHVIGGATVDTLSLTGDTITSNITNNNINLVPDGLGFVVSSKAKVSNLLIDRIVYVSSSTGELTSDPNIKFTPAGGLVSTLATLGTIDFATDTITVAGNLNITATGNEIVLNSVKVTDLTAGRIPYVGALQEVQDSANMSWDNGTSTLNVTGIATVDNIKLDGSIVESTTGALLLSSPAATITHITGTTGVRVPSGSTIQRPGAPTAADLRFNTTNSVLEYYDGSVWAVAGTDFTAISTNCFHGDDVTTVFTLSEPASAAGNLIVSINGIMEQPLAAYTVSGTTLTFSAAPATGDVIDIRNVTHSYSIDSLSDPDGTTVIAIVNDEVVLKTNSLERLAIDVNGVIDATNAKTVRFPSYTVSQTNALGTPVAGDTVFVTDASPAATLATYDGTNWKMMTLAGTLA
jgi:hypothetical protein